MKNSQNFYDSKEIKNKPVEFLYIPPPGLNSKQTERPEDNIPDLPENKEVREFLKKAPSKGLWMPLGKEVKIMQCWRCKAYGHRAADRECPLSMSGNEQQQLQAKSREDPMANYIKGQDILKKQKREEKLERIRQLKAILEMDSKKKNKKHKSKHKHKSKKKHKSKEEGESNDSNSSSDNESSNEEKHKSKKKKHKSKEENSDSNSSSDNESSNEEKHKSGI